MATLKRYLIERDVPGVGGMSIIEWCGVARASNQAIDKIGQRIQWQHSYVAGDKTFCIYLADGEDTIRRHAEFSGIPVSQDHGNSADRRPAHRQQLTQASSSTTGGPGQTPGRINHATSTGKTSRLCGQDARRSRRRIQRFDRAYRIAAGPVRDPAQDRSGNLGRIGRPRRQAVGTLCARMGLCPGRERLRPIRRREPQIFACRPNRRWCSAKRTARFTWPALSISPPP